MSGKTTQSAVGTTCELSLHCDLAAVPQAAVAVRDFLGRQDVIPADIGSCELALVEACNNAIRYCRAEARGLPIEVQIFCRPSSIELHVVDHTAGFDWPQNAQLPPASAEQGRGLFIIQSLIDESKYLKGSGENRLILKKARTAISSRVSDAARDLDSPEPHNRSDIGRSFGIEDVQQKLALSEQVIRTMAKEICFRSEEIAAIFRSTSDPHASKEYDAISDTLRLYQEQLDYRLTTHELEIARKIQQSLLPRVFPTITGYGLAGYCASARQVGGDFYDVLSLGENKTLLVVADVMGKGVPAALFAATLHTLIRAIADSTHQPSELLARVNHLSYDDLSGVDMFITAQLALIDTEKRELLVANAGHCPLLVTNDKGETRQIAPDGMPLGILQDVVFEQQSVAFEECHCALLYTDGLTEAKNAMGELFGRSRLADWLAAACACLQTPAELSASFCAELKQFQGEMPLNDDQTFLILAQEPAVLRDTGESCQAFATPLCVQPNS